MESNQTVAYRFDICGLAYTHDPHDAQGPSDGHDTAVFTVGSQVYTVNNSKIYRYWLQRIISWWAGCKGF